MTKVTHPEEWMARALQLARKGLYSTHPNPRVGCVIVRNNKCIAEGYHEFPGGAHAEINALNKLNGNAEGSTVFVTLEPCSHIGKTPPCTDALISSKPDHVVIAMKDPNPLVAGSGIAKLQQAGIQVTVGVLQQQAEQLNAGFIKRMTRDMPFVRVKMAMSLDGRIALANGDSKWITGEAARMDVQRLRAQSSAVLSTATTVIADQASLNVRLTEQDLAQPSKIRQPVRVILDSHLSLSGEETLFSSEGDIWIFTALDSSEMNNRFSRPNVKVFSIPSSQESGMDLTRLMHKLAELEINEVHTECGSRLAGALIQQGLVDELVIYMAPSLLGDKARGVFNLGEITHMSGKFNVSIQDIRSIGADIRIVAKII